MMEYDGHFYIENEVRINYRVDPNFHGEVYQHGELIKASRMLYFYGEFGKSLGFEPYFAELEKLTTVSSAEALMVYLRKESRK